MKLGIPTLCRYDLLDRLIASAEAGLMRPTEYIIVDNGGGWSPPPALEGRIRVISLGENIGVAASWNVLLDCANDEPIVISNDDIVFFPETFAAFAKALETHDFVGLDHGQGGGWACFGQTPAVADKIGYYDEHFFPAYYEDCDYRIRLEHAGIEIFSLATGHTHTGSATPEHASPEQRAEINEGRLHGYAYFLNKWGNESKRWANNASDPLIVHYGKAFDGHAPPDFYERARKPIASWLRWDVINHVARAIGAKRYLEIGVGDGGSMRRVECAEKWGVDPSPHLDGVAATDVFSPMTSDRFFREVAPGAGKFDLVFIDGDHRAEVVYREVQNAVACLSPNGVIVVHNCSPYLERMQEVPLRFGFQWTGDVWKAIALLRHEGEHEIAVVNTDYGIGVIVPGHGQGTNSSWSPPTWSDLVS